MDPTQATLSFCGSAAAGIAQVDLGDEDDIAVAI
jgi:hypothetical protein